MTLEKVFIVIAVIFGLAIMEYIKSKKLPDNCTDIKKIRRKK